MSKRLLIVSNGLYGGGAEKVLQTLVCSLDRNAYDILLLAVSGSAGSEGYPEWVKIKSVFKNAGRNKDGYGLKTFFLKVFNKVIQFLYDNFSPALFYRLFVPKGYDIEIAFIEGYATRIISGSSNAGSRKIAWVHTDLLNNHWTDIAYRDLTEESHAYGQFDDIVCVSESVKESMGVLFPGLKGLTVLYNPVDDDQIRRLAMAPCSEELFHKGQPTLISIGRLVPQKGYDRLFPILKRLHDEGFGFVINILGDGPERSLLKRIISDNDMGGYVHLLGFVANPFPYLQASDLYVCSSRSEGYSTVIIESLVLGVPVIATDCAGMSDLLGDSLYGLVVRNDDESLYDGLKTLLSDDTARYYYRRKAEERGRDFKKELLLSKIKCLL